MAEDSGTEENAVNVVEAGTIGLEQMVAEAGIGEFTGDIRDVLGEDVLDPAEADVEDEDGNEGYEYSQTDDHDKYAAEDPHEELPVIEQSLYMQIHFPFN